MRSQKIKLAKDIPQLTKFISSRIPEIIIDACKEGKTILCEISQGVHLSIDSEFYPYCTSRPINVGQALAYLDVPPSLVGDVIGIARSYPIRVGNVPNGQSGDVFPDSKEISWPQLAKHINKPGLLELTTVTKRVRRVFTFSRIGIEKSIRRNNINILFLSFADYLLPNEKEVMKDYLISINKTTPDNDGHVYGQLKQIYFVNGFGNFDENIEKVR